MGIKLIIDHKNEFTSTQNLSVCGGKKRPTKLKKTNMTTPDDHKL